MSTVRTYVPSGRFDGHALATVPLVGITAGAVLATLYAYVTLYLPIVGTVSFILTGGLGLLLGTALSWALKRGRVRSRAVGFALAAFAALVTLYVSWAVWTYALLRRDDVDVSFVAVLLQPGALWKLIVAINEHGAWSLKGFTPTGAVLWVLWTLEAGILVGVPLLLADIAVMTPFCEACGAYCDETKGVRVTAVPPEGRATVLAVAERNDVAALGALGSPDAGGPFVQWDLHACGCGELTTLSATQVVPTVDKHGKPGQETNVWLQHWVLERAQGAALRAEVPRASGELVPVKQA